MRDRTESVTRIRAGVVIDRDGNERESWADEDVQSVTTDGWLVEPRPLPEATQDSRNAIVSGHTLYAPGPADVTEHDRMRVRGEVEQVDGRPALWQTHDGPRVVVQTKRSEG